MSYPERSGTSQRVPGAPTETFVLVRDRVADDRRAATVGVLIDSDIVMVPRPPAKLLDHGRQVDAILCGPPGGDAPEPERIAARRSAVLSVAGAGTVVAYVELDRPSRHPSLNVTRDDKSRLLDALDGCAGDYWAAMQGVGIVSDPRDRFAAGTLWPVTGLDDGAVPGFAGGSLDTRELVYQSMNDLAAAGCCPAKGCCKKVLFGL